MTAVVTRLSYVFIDNRFPETGPAGARIEFDVRTKQLAAAANTFVSSLFFQLVISARKGRLGGFLPGGPLCFVNFEHFARFAQYWLEPGAGLPADLDQLNGVNGVDLRLFVEQWLCYCPTDWPLK